MGVIVKNLDDENLLKEIEKLSNKGEFKSFAKALINCEEEYSIDIYRLFTKEQFEISDVIRKNGNVVNDFVITNQGRTIKEHSIRYSQLSSDLRIYDSALASEVYSGENFVKRGARILQGESEITYKTLKSYPIDYIMTLGDSKFAVQVTRGFSSRGTYTKILARDQILNKISNLNKGISDLTDNNKNIKKGIVHILVPNKKNKELIESVTKELREDFPGIFEENNIVVTVADKAEFIFN